MERAVAASTACTQADMLLALGLHVLAITITTVLLVPPLSAAAA